MLTRALLCAACALLVAATPAHATFPGKNGKIVFMSFDGFDDTRTDIYTMSPNGRHPLNLTPHSLADDQSPRWSPDGQKIAFWSKWTGPTNLDGDQELFVMNADGSGLRRVTFNAVDDGGPAWSPDGGRLVFHRWLDDSNADLMTMRVNGTGECNLTQSPGVVDFFAVWSPDGREIAFTHRDDTALENDIYTIHPDGSHLRPMISSPTDEEMPDWSPDGQRIAFQSNAAMPSEPHLQWDIYVMRRDGGSPTRLTTAEGGHAAWSPDGRKIAFGSFRTGNSEIYTMRADGTRQKQRTVRPDSLDWMPDWQALPEHERAEEDDD